MKLKAIIVDDEADSRALLAKRINTWLSDIEVVSSCALPSLALMDIVKFRPDIVFLDIQMPEMTGFEFFHHLSTINIPTQCILVTAHAEPAYYKEAIRLGLTDFLLKPVLQEELEAAVQNAINRLAKGSAIADINGISLLLQQQQKQITFEITTGLIQLTQPQILYIKSSGKYCELYMTTGEKEVVRNGIGELEIMLQQVLPGTTLVKIDRFIIINTQYIFKVSKLLNKIFFDKTVFKKDIEISEPGTIKILEILKIKNGL